MNYPAIITAATKLAFLLRAHELLRLDFNANGKLFRDGALSKAQWDDYVAAYKVKAESINADMAPLAAIKMQAAATALGMTLKQFVKTDVDGIFAPLRNAVTYDGIIDLKALV